MTHRKEFGLDQILVIQKTLGKHLARVTRVLIATVEGAAPDPFQVGMEPCGAKRYTVPVHCAHGIPSLARN